MKKFQNLIANKIKHKNNLLQADMLRVYPLTKKGRAGMTLYDTDMSNCEQGTTMAHLAAVVSSTSHSRSPPRQNNRHHVASKKSRLLKGANAAAKTGSTSHARKKSTSSGDAETAMLQAAGGEY